MKRILLLSNSYPFSGETFLETELELLGEEWHIDLWPLFAGEGEPPHMLRNNIAVHTLRRQKKLDGRAAICSVVKLLTSKEIASARKHRGMARNIGKALKFAYQAERRLQGVERWLRQQERLGTQPTIVYSYWMYEAAYIAARLKRRHRNIQAVTRCHGYDLYEGRHIHGYLPFRRFILENMDLICPISQNGYDYLKEKYQGQYVQKTKLCRLGSIKRYEDQAEKRTQDRTVIVSCSNVVEVKRLDLIVEALMQCQTKLVWYHFGDGELLGALKERCHRLPENVEVCFFGRVDNAAVQKFYADNHVDAFLNVSESEGAPVSIMEAQSYGIPVVATNVGGTAELVTDRQNGILLEKNFTGEELLEAVETDRAHWNDYSKMSYQAWEKQSDAHKTVWTFYDAIDHLGER